MGVDSCAEVVVPAICVLGPEREIIGRAVRRGLCPQWQWGRRVVWGWQGYRAPGGVDVGDTHLLGHRAKGELQCDARHENVTDLGCRRDRPALAGDRVIQ